MSALSLLAVSSSTWAGIVIVALPALIIGVGELEERLRQRDSPFREAVSTLRVWVVPLLALWFLSRTLFEASRDGVPLRLLDTAVVVAVAVTVLSALRVIVSRLVDRPRESGHRSVPRLVLAMPRLALILVTIWVLIAGVWGVDLSLRH